MLCRGAKINTWGERANTAHYIMSECPCYCISLFIQVAASIHAANLFFIAWIHFSQYLTAILVQMPVFNVSKKVLILK